MNILTVSQVNGYAKAILDEDPVLSDVYVSGEISNLKRHSSGHMYFSLKDSGGQLSAAMFKWQCQYLRFAPANGMKVVAHGRISIYETGGQYQMVVSSLQPDGIGALYAAYEQLKAKLEADPSADFYMEQVAISRALRHWQELDMEGLVLMEGDDLLAMTMGSHLSCDTFDVQFEKAIEETAYVAMCSGFAAYLMDKYPDLAYLNREDDLGIEGLRKSKLAYNPVELIEKHWACLKENGCDY